MLGCCVLFLCTLLVRSSGNEDRQGFSENGEENIEEKTVHNPNVLPDVRGYCGMLTPVCVKQYYRLYVTHSVPPRTYHYYHEVTSPTTHEKDSDESVEIGWRIVGGRTVTIQEVPFQVLYGKFCGGALLAPEWVITAAHCKDTERFVFAGSTHRSRAHSYTICAHFIHPLWNVSRLHSHDYDYQLLLLERPVPPTPSSLPIAIGNYADIERGAMVAVSGWGHLTYSKKSKMVDVLRRTYVPVMADEVCRQMPDGNYDKITPRMFCAGYINGTKDSCQGDSGGPAVINGKLVGIVSYGVGCAGVRHPGVYSHIPAARDWIRTVTGLPL